MKKFNAKTYLKLLMVVGLIAVAGGSAGTFASFTAETTNAGNTFATGTLLLSNDTDSAAICYSNADTANAKNCSALFTATAKKPGDSQANYLTIKNEGTINATALKLYIPQTQNSNADYCVTSNSPASLPGSQTLDRSGDLCTELLISVEADTTAGDSNTATACLVGTAVGGAGLDQNACDPSQGVALSTIEGSSNAINFGALASSAAKNYKVYLYLPSTADNTFQGRSALFDLLWHIDQ